MKPSKLPGARLIRTGTAEFLIFSRRAGEESIEARYEDETVWVSQKLMATLFDVEVPTTEHLKFEVRRVKVEGGTGAKGEVRSVKCERDPVTGAPIWPGAMVSNFKLQTSDFKLQRGNEVTEAPPLDLTDDILAQVREITEGLAQVGALLPAERRISLRRANRRMRCPAHENVIVKRG